MCNKLPMRFRTTPAFIKSNGYFNPDLYTNLIKVEKV